MITISGEENDVKRSQSSSLLHKSKSILHSKYDSKQHFTASPESDGTDGILVLMYSIFLLFRIRNEPTPTAEAIKISGFK